MREAQTLSMATSMPTAKKAKITAEVVGGNALPASQSRFFSFIEQNRVAVLASPFCLAAIMISLNIFAGRKIHAVIDFLTGFSQR